jgi:hypothetical protein
VSWTEEGHRFAWRMMLRTKYAQVEFTAHDPRTGKTWAIDERDYLKGWQARFMRTRPDMIQQFSHYLAAELRKRGHDPIEIRVRAMATLNGRSPQLLIDPTVNLAAQPRTLRHARWILPLSEGLPAKAAGPAAGRLAPPPPR